MEILTVLILFDPDSGGYVTALPQGSKTKQHHQNDWSTISLIETGISFRGYRVEQEEGLGTCEKLLAVICKRRYSQQGI